MQEEQQFPGILRSSLLRELDGSTFNSQLEIQGTDLTLSSL
jgi:hypothetical protein